jgi:hypothetical protein
VNDSYKSEVGFEVYEDTIVPSPTEASFAPIDSNSLQFTAVNAVDSYSSLDSLDMARIISRLDVLTTEEVELPNTSECLFDTSECVGDDLDTAFICQSEESYLGSIFTLNHHSYRLICVASDYI